MRDNMRMPEKSGAIEVFKNFVSAVNRQDVKAISDLLAPDHVFVDALGNRVNGAKAMEAGWRGYFAMCPDYWICHEDALSEGGTVLASGEAGGTIDGERWRMPAAWKAVIRDGTLAEWRVFADNKPVYEILARRQKK